MIPIPTPTASTATATTAMINIPHDIAHLDPHSGQLGPQTRDVFTQSEGRAELVGVRLGEGREGRREVRGVVLEVGEGRNQGGGRGGRREVAGGVARRRGALGRCGSREGGGRRAVAVEVAVADETADVRQPGRCKLAQTGRQRLHHLCEPVQPLLGDLYPLPKLPILILELEDLAIRAVKVRAQGFVRAFRGEVVLFEEGARARVGTTARGVRARAGDDGAG